jgi:hypothetical protein
MIRRRGKHRKPVAAPKPKVTIPPEARARLLEQMGNGHDLESAAADAGVQLSAIRRDQELLEDCRAAYRLGTSKLRARTLEKALIGGDVHVLERAIERRELAEREAFTAAAEAQADWPDLSGLSDFQLALLEAAATLDLAELDRLVDDLVASRAAALARSLAAETLQRQLGPDVRVTLTDDLPMLDPEAPLKSDRAVVLRR